MKKNFAKQRSKILVVSFTVFVISTHACSYIDRTEANPTPMPTSTTKSTKTNQEQDRCESELVKVTGAAAYKVEWSNDSSSIYYFLDRGLSDRYVYHIESQTAEAEQTISPSPEPTSLPFVKQLLASSINPTFLSISQDNQKAIFTLGELLESVPRDTNTVTPDFLVPLYLVSYDNPEPVLLGHIDELIGDAAWFNDGNRVLVDIARSYPIENYIWDVNLQNRSVEPFLPEAGQSRAGIVALAPDDSKVIYFYDDRLWVRSFLFLGEDRELPFLITVYSWWVDTGDKIIFLRSIEPDLDFQTVSMYDFTTETLHDTSNIEVAVNFSSLNSVSISPDKRILAFHGEKDYELYLLTLCYDE